MSSKDHEAYPIDPTQRLYARVLAAVVLVDLVGLLIGLIVYAGNALPSAIAIESIPDLWHLSAEELSARTGSSGWAWLRSLGDGRNIAFASLIAFPASMILMTAVATVLYLVHRARIYAIITAMVLIAFLIAASGMVS